MSTVTISTTMTSTQPTEPNTNVVGVIWGYLYKKSFKDMLRENLRHPEPKGKKTSEPVPDDDEEAPLPTAQRLTISFDPIPSQEVILPVGVTSFDVSDVINIRYHVNLTAIDSQGESASAKGRGSKSKARASSKSVSNGGNGPSRSSTKGQGSKTTTRVSRKHDMGWVPITQNGQPYPDQDNRSVSSHKIGPVVNGDNQLDCDLVNDIFVFDRNVLGTLERPSGSDRAEAINIFRDRDNERAQKGRRVNQKDEVVLRPRNVALNVNDIGSILIYLDLLVRARQDPSLAGDFENRTVTFFSGPDVCDHKDCHALRGQMPAGLRVHGAKNILKHPWWSFGDFCFRDPDSSITFKDSVHDEDLMSGPMLPDNVRMDVEEQRQIRTWYHALLNHFPTGVGEEAVCRTQFSVLNWKNKFPQLVDEANGCANIARATRDRELIKMLIDPEVVGCFLCGRPGFGLNHYTNSPIPKNAETGLMYLHCMDGEEIDMEPDEEGKEKGKEQETSFNPQGYGDGAVASTSAGASAGASVDTNVNDENGVGNAGDIGDSDDSVGDLYS